MSRATENREKKPLIWAELSTRVADGRTSGAARSQGGLHLLTKGSFEPYKGFQVVSRQLACGIPCKKMEGAAFEVVAKREVKAIIYRARALDPGFLYLPMILRPLQTRTHFIRYRPQLNISHLWRRSSERAYRPHQCPCACSIKCSSHSAAHTMAHVSSSRLSTAS